MQGEMACFEAVSDETRSAGDCRDRIAIRDGSAARPPDEFQSKMLQTEKMAALGQMVSGIAHELNNPLTAIMGYAQLMLGHGLDARSSSLRPPKSIRRRSGRAES